MDFDDDFGAGVGAGGDDSLQEFAAMYGEEGVNAEEQLALANETQPTTLANTTADALESMDFELPPVHIRNLIASVQMKCEIDLRLVTISARNIEYSPRKLNAAVMRLQNPRVTATIFQNGRIAVCGAKSPDTAKRAAKIVARVCQKAGHPEVRFVGFKVETLVCSAACGFPVRLENLAKDHAPFCNYEPEIFCGLVYRYNPGEGRKASVLIFVSGKLIITGCRSVQEAGEAFRSLYAVLYQYRA